MAPHGITYPIRSRYFAIDVDANGDEIIECDDEVLIIPIAGSGEIILITEPAPAFNQERQFFFQGAP
jgi:hypothetical protein